MPGMRILIAEDEQNISRLITRVLEAAGHNVEGVRSCSEAIDRLARNRWDLLLLDLHLADGDGFPVVEAMERTGNAAAVVVMTGERAFDEDPRAGRVAGILLKPFALSELERVVGRLSASA